MNEQRLIETKVTSFAKLFDHSIVRPDTTRDQVRAFADAAARLGTATPACSHTKSVSPLNCCEVQNGEKALFIRDVEGVVRAAAGVKVKVITENCYLTQEEKRRACEWIAQAGARRFGSTRTDDFVRAFQELPTTKEPPLRTTCRGCRTDTRRERPNQRMKLTKRGPDFREGTKTFPSSLSRASQLSAVCHGEPL